MQKQAGGKWYSVPAQGVLDALGVSPDGLSSEEAAARLRAHGHNTIRTGKETSPWTILLHQLKSPLIYILLAVTVVTLAIRHWADAIVIGIVVVLNTVIGFVQEYRAENAMQALLSMTTPRARVRRDGEQSRIDSADLVPGDIVLLEAGDIVPADLRLLGANRLAIDESLLTGESLPAAKTPEALSEAAEVPPANQRNMSFMGTAVTSGKGTGVVVATGLRTEIGSIAEGLVGTKRAETPLQTRMKRFGWLVTFAVVGASVVAFAVGLALGEGLVDMFLTAVAISVSAIPEGLPVVMSIALAVGVRRMARRNAIIRRLPAAETLGSCTVILSDKTGTLTQNQMTVQEIWSAGSSYRVSGGGLDLQGRIERDGVAVEVEPESPLYLTLAAGMLANESSVFVDEGVLVPTGDPTEVALLVSGAKAHLFTEGLLERYPVSAEIPFDAEWMFSATVHSHNGREVVFVKGAPERVLE
ncbi:MAG: cation-translocating P-type ATPase, partial [Chloroflexota bacterium]